MFILLFEVPPKKRRARGAPLHSQVSIYEVAHDSDPVPPIVRIATVPVKSDPTHLNAVDPNVLVVIVPPLVLQLPRRTSSH